MFGYVKPLQQDLKVRELELYKAVYCGLCHELKGKFGKMASMALSYDFSFLALLKMGLEEKPDFQFSRQRCPYHPTAKRGVCASNEALSFAAHMTCITFYHKVNDNIQDSPFWKKAAFAALLPFASHWRKQAASSYGELDQFIGRQMERQRQLEQGNCSLIDQAAQPTAEMLSAICGEMAAGETQRRILSRLGYFLGRWVYLCDALDDLEDDQKKGGYNPFLLSSESIDSAPSDLSQIRKDASGTMNLTLAEIEKTYNLLSVKQFQPILDNILYLGLRSVQQQILTRTKQGELSPFPGTTGQ